MVWTKHISIQRGKIAQSTHDEREQFPADPGMVWFQSSPTSRSISLQCVGKSISIAFQRLITLGVARGVSELLRRLRGSRRKLYMRAIAWRAYERHGQNVRKVCQQTLEKIDEIETTFLSRDPRKGRALVAPRGPCPVLLEFVVVSRRCQKIWWTTSERWTYWTLCWYASFQRIKQLMTTLANQWLLK